MTPLVSIIIPVYKVEKYIEKCMQSLLDQTYDNFEALVVDDGSPDSSIALAKELVGNDSRFIFFEKENGGQGSARNLGLDHARGEYIAFLDSDDSYTPYALETIVTEFKENSSFSILCFGVNKVDERGRLIQKSYSAGSITNTDSDVLLLKRTLTNYFWDKVFLSKHIKKFRFSIDIKTYEDVDLIYQVVFGQNIKVISSCLYNYTQRLGSTTYSVPISFIEDKKRVVKNSKDFLQKNDLLDNHRAYFNTYYLLEIFNKPLSTLIFFSRDFKHYQTNAKKLRQSDISIITIRNIRRLKKTRGLNIKTAILLYSFKLNSNLPYIIAKSKKIIKLKIKRLN
ncbi:glycosyltransferase family A protein [uncultured Psychrobacter sp.]|uniref:glycosyltransferase family 2 protein n=1 Tax=uncultured Psychrobacter sp. TaxID=259303 RepID=UPI0026061ED8|nr:glycosyltransferase family A protein [uncultured Psychrobacter sp.]